MELRHIESFQAILQEGSFLRAAEKLQYAQSTITVHIQQLEAELGVKLFARQGKQIQLTAAGQALQAQADALLQRSRALQQTMKEIVAGETGHVRLGANESTASLRLAPLLATFCQEHPQIHLTLEVEGTRVVGQRVAARELDIGICAAPASHLGLSFEPLFVEEIVVLIPACHPLAQKEFLNPADIDGQRVLLTERGCRYRAAIEAALSARGLNPFSGIEISSIEVLKRLVQEGLGLALLPSVAVSPPPPQTVVRSMQGVDLCLPIGLIGYPETFASGRPLSSLLTLLRTRLQETTPSGKKWAL